jgi:hypothetical protein
MHRIRLAGALLGLLFCRTEALAAQANDSGGLTITVPDSVRLFRRTETQRYPDPADGMLFRFRRSDGLGADAFLYPGPDFGKDCDIACARELIAREGNQFIGSFPELVRRKYLDTIANVRDSVLTPPSQARWRIGRHIQFETRVHGEARWSEMFLYYQPELRVKVRATYVPGDAHQRDIAEFARSLMDAIANGGAAARASALNGLVNITTRFSGSPVAHYRTALAVLRSQGYDVDRDSSTAPWRIVTKGRFAPSALTDTEAGHLTESPGVMLIVELRAEGDSTRIVATPRSPLRPGWTDTHAANTLRLLSMARFMTAFEDSTRAATAAAPRTPEHSFDAPASPQSASAAADASAPPAPCVSTAHTTQRCPVAPS